MSDSNPSDTGQTYTPAMAPLHSSTRLSATRVTLAATYPCDLSILGVNFAGGLCKLSASATESVQ